jgi:chemotaxis protein methyltransferase CheR
MLSAASFTALPDNTAIAIPANLQQSSAIAVPEKSGLVDLYAIQQLILGGEAQRALRLLDALPAQESQSYGAYLLKSWLLINKQAFAEAEQLLEQALSIEPWSVDAILMKGLIFKWRNQENEACRWFKKAIYTCSECWPAHYYLAEIRRAEQDIDVAIQSYQRVLRVLAAYPSEDKCMEWIPLPLAASDAEFLSQRYIQQLTAVSPSVQVDN